MFVLGTTNKALADEALFATRHYQRHERSKGLPPTVETREVRSRYLGDEVKIACNFDRVKSVGRVDDRCLESGHVFWRGMRCKLQT
jgi:hypothetical protein